MVYAGIGLIALCAGAVQGVTGFGAGVVMMMVIPAFFPLNQAAGISSAIAVIQSLFMALRYRRYVQVKKVLGPAVLYVTISGLSIYFSTLVNQAAMKKVLGVFLIVLAAYYLFFNKKEAGTLSFPVKLVFIAASGICDGLFGIGGPLMVLYYLGQTKSKEEYLGTIQALFCVTVAYGTMMRMYSHILTPTHLPYIGIGMVCIMAGLGIANKIVDRLDGEKVKQITYVMIGVSGVLNVL